MVHPDGRIDQDQADLARRRGGAFRSGSLPPRRASLRALSRSMSALSASRTRLDFSFKPVKACALATSSSSSASVVRIIETPLLAPNLASYDADSNACVECRQRTRPLVAWGLDGIDWDDRY